MARTSPAMTAAIFVEADEGVAASPRRTYETTFAPVHPGEVLKEEFLKPLGLSANALARAACEMPERPEPLFP